ncbi:MAG TPA: type II toxin-antitoxin system RelE/ParE family toxin [Roseiarcus sp.]|nr:type II toxin-antitoxin system RelE/ParE family toxin [Roseiarcus sp.]
MGRFVEKGLPRFSRLDEGRDGRRARSGSIWGKHPSAKPWKGLGSGVFEIIENHAGNIYRAVYVVRFPEVVYVLHAFQKKSPKGIKTRFRTSNSSRDG